MKIIEAVDVSKSFTCGDVEEQVLKEISLTIEQGDFLSIMGASGSGKSTLLYLLAGFDNVSAGKVLFGDEDLTKLNDKQLSVLRRRSMGFIFQFYNLVPNLTVEENILLPVVLDGINPKSYKEKLDFLLETVGLENKRKLTPRELSGGQQQRVAIARGLINDPKIILADEPIGNLDSKSGEDIMNLLAKINEEQNITIVQVTHSAAAAEYGNKIIYVKDGSIVDEIV